MVALALDYVMDCKTELEIKQKDCLSFSYPDKKNFEIEKLDNYIDCADAKEIRKIFTHMWHDWVVDYPSELYLGIFSESRAIEDPEKLLFWSFVFCLWSRFDIRGTRWALYKRLLSNSFWMFWDDYNSKRQTLKEYRCGW